MLKLKNVSKYYYNKGVIASGFNNISVKFDLGEFVAIVGESGSGKSTLLNVISGLDSYEEGEMYINGEETSHYRECDFEEYRKKYISNIFQNFNLVNSYTVYQNIELVMLLNGYKRRDVKSRVLELIDKVGLTKYKNTRTAKLSGGQKQRVAIARALARETPIIVCDEPTGNLDSKSSKEIIKLLKDISKDKLVIVVTHNIEQIEDIATRIIRMHDGKIISDKKVKEILKVDDVKVLDTNNIGIFNIIRLGLRNVFNLIPKFILLFFVFLFIACSLLTEYASMKKTSYEESRHGYNNYFMDVNDKRIIVKKNDNSIFSDDDFNNIGSINNIDNIVKYDVLVDTDVWFSNNDGEFFMNGILDDVLSIDGELVYGRMPENDNEVVYETYDYDYIFVDRLEEAVLKSYQDVYGLSVKVVGVIYKDNDYDNNKIYGTSNFIKKYMKYINREYSDVKVNINGKNYDSYNYVNNFAIRVKDNIDSGCAYVSEDISYTCKDFNCKNKDLKILIDNLYYQDDISLKICNVYNQKNVNNLLGISKDDYGYGSIYISDSDYNRLFYKDSYQVSIYVDKIDNIDKVSSELENLGYKTLQIRKTFSNAGADIIKIFNIIRLVVTVLMVITLFFISYFVIKLILKSRNTYYSILRILGGNYKHIKHITDVELLFDASISYLFYMILILLGKYDVINVDMIDTCLEYLRLGDYIFMYVILIVMSYIISVRFSNKLFKKSALKSYREEV